MTGQEYTEIKKDLLDIIISNAEIKEKVNSNHKAFREFEDRTEDFRKEFKHTIYGNGEPGLKSSYEMLKKLPDKVEKIEQRLAFYLGGGTVVGVMVGFLLNWILK